ncbi:MAG: NAD(P)H-dependent oxidoreductase [Patescibacteria group bacterium]|jgi:nitroreductase
MDLRKQIVEAFQFRHACKEFDSKCKIAEDDFTVILEAARLSPSSFGFEPWKFVVLQSVKLREKIRPVCWGAQTQLSTASHFVIIFARKGADMNYDSDYIKTTMSRLQKSPPEVVKKRLERLKNFQRNDFNLTSERELFDWARMQTYIVLGNMMTSAALLGIDSCPIEGFNREQVERILEQEKVFDEKHFEVSCMVAFGYRVANPKEKRTRRSPDEVAEWVVD